jgi:branched-subunit amino acid transport protein
MISLQVFFMQLAVMAGVTYLIRAIPLVLCKGEVTNRFFRSFLAYVPYAVLGAMTFPAILFSTDGLVSSAAGTIVALVLAFGRKSLLTVAVGACVAAFLVKAAMMLF